MPSVLIPDNALSQLGCLQLWYLYCPEYSGCSIGEDNHEIIFRPSLRADFTLDSKEFSRSSFEFDDDTDEEDDDFECELYEDRTKREEMDNIYRRG